MLRRPSSQFKNKIMHFLSPSIVLNICLCISVKEGGEEEAAGLIGIKANRTLGEKADKHLTSTHVLNKKDSVNLLYEEGRQERGYEIQIKWCRSYLCISWS